MNRFKAMGKWFIPWNRFIGLAAALFLARGLMVLAILPPLEGWDEYQHLAHIHHLVEQGETPILNQAMISPSLLVRIPDYPHSLHSLKQLGPTGARSYSDFWNGNESNPTTDRHAAIGLYQAQHAPLYYRMMAPIHRALGGPDRLLLVITVLRLINLLFGAASIALFGFFLGQGVSEGPFRCLLLLLAALHPLYLLNVTRIANDSLAVLLATAAVGVLLCWTKARPLLVGATGGLLIGLATLAKTVNLGLAPFAACLLFVLIWRRSISLRQGIGALGLLILVLGMTTASHFAFNLRTYGLLTPMQEGLVNKEAGRSAWDLARNALEIDWWREFSRRYFRHSLWVGGWSLLKPGTVFVRLQQALFFFAMLGGLCHCFRRHSQKPPLTKGTATLLILLAVNIALGLAYHMVQTRSALGFVGTNIWYAAATFPWLLALVTQGWHGLGARAAAWLGVSLMAVFIAAEIHGVFFVMAPFYANSQSIPEILSRLGRLHLGLLGPWLSAPMAFLAIAMSAVSAANFWTALAQDGIDPLKIDWSVWRLPSMPWLNHRGGSPTWKMRTSSRGGSS